MFMLKFRHLFKPALHNNRNILKPLSLLLEFDNKEKYACLFNTIHVAAIHAFPAVVAYCAYLLAT